MLKCVGCCHIINDNRKPVWNVKCKYVDRKVIGDILYVGSNSVFPICHCLWYKPVWTFKYSWIESYHIENEG